MITAFTLNELGHVYFYIHWLTFGKIGSWSPRCRDTCNEALCRHTHTNTPVRTIKLHNVLYKLHTNELLPPKSLIINELMNEFVNSVMYVCMLLYKPKEGYLTMNVAEKICNKNIWKNIVRLVCRNLLYFGVMLVAAVLGVLNNLNTPERYEIHVACL